MRIRWGHIAPFSLAVGYLAIAVAYGSLNPIFEAPDELWHFLYVKQLQNTHALPIQDPTQKEAGARQEGSQPPLYYLLAATLTAPFQTNDLPAVSQLNPNHRAGAVFAPDERNVVIHTEKESIAVSETARVVRLIRLFSTLLGLATVLLTYAIALEVLPGKRWLALAAAACVAFLPQFVLLSAAINNDNLAVAAATLCLWLLLRYRRQPSGRWLVLLGLASGIAALTKLSAIGLAPAIGVGIITARGSNSWRGAARRLAIVIAPALIVAGWWYARNLVLYGDPLGLNMMLAMVGRREQPVDLARLVNELWLIKASFWGLFGWMNVPADDWFYFTSDVIVLLGLAGILLQVVQRDLRHSPRELGTLAVWFVVILISFANWNRLTVATQGRLLFSALAPLAILLVWGLAAFRWRGFPVAPVATALVMPAMAIYALGSYVVPSYSFLPVTTPAALPADVRTLSIDFGGKYRLLGIRLPKEAMHVGGTLPVALYWQRIDANAPDYVRFVHLNAAGGTVATGGDSVFPSYWTGEDVLRDDRLLRVPAADGPLIANLTVGLYDQANENRLPAMNGQGVPLGDAPSIAEVKLLPVGPVALRGPERPSQRLGREIALEEVTLSARTIQAGESLIGRMVWRALVKPGIDYTVFVHLAKEDKPVAQYDGQPRHGQYRTSAWDKDELVPDEFAITTDGQLSAGDYHLLLGMYDHLTGRRLGDSIDLGIITILK